MRVVCFILFLLLVEHVCAQQVTTKNEFKTLLCGDNVWVEKCYVRNDTLFSSNINEYNLAAVKYFYLYEYKKEKSGCAFFKNIDIIFDNSIGEIQVITSPHFPTICICQKIGDNRYSGEFFDSYDYEKPFEDIIVTFYNEEMFSYTKKSEIGITTFFMKNILFIPYLKDDKEILLKL